MIKRNTSNVYLNEDCTNFTRKILIGLKFNGLEIFKINSRQNRLINKQLKTIDFETK